MVDVNLYKCECDISLQIMAYEPTVIFQDIRFIPLKQHSYSFRVAVHAQHLF